MTTTTLLLGLSPELQPLRVFVAIVAYMVVGLATFLTGLLVIARFPGLRWIWRKAVVEPVEEWRDVPSAEVRIHLEAIHADLTERDDRLAGRLDQYDSMLTRLDIAVNNVPPGEMPLVERVRGIETSLHTITALLTTGKAEAE